MEPVSFVEKVSEMLRLTLHPDLKYPATLSNRLRLVNSRRWDFEEIVTHFGSIVRSQRIFSYLFRRRHAGEGVVVAYFGPENFSQGLLVLGATKQYEP